MLACIRASTVCSATSWIFSIGWPFVCERLEIQAIRIVMSPTGGWRIRLTGLRHIEQRCRTN